MNLLSVNIAARAVSLIVRSNFERRKTMRKITSILLVFAIALSCFVFVGCDTEDKLGFFKERKIKRDYIEQFDIRGKNVGDVVLDYYGGNYNGYEIVMLDTECHDPETRTEQIGDTTITYYDSNQLYAWGDGEFYPLNNVVSTNKISKEDVNSIVAKYSSKINQFADVCDEYDFERKCETVSNWELLTTFEYDSIQFSRLAVVMDPKLSREDIILDESFFETNLIRKSTKMADVEGYPDSCWYQVWLKEHSLLYMSIAIAELKRIPGIISITPMILSGYSSTPSDPSYTSGSQWGFEAIDVEKVWDFTTGTTAISVGVVDSGIDLHSDLEINLALGYDFYNNSSIANDDALGHGTHISGIIGAIGNNGVGISGVNWDVTLVPLQNITAVDNAGYNGLYNYRPDGDAATEAVNYAIQSYNTSNPIKVLNMSFVLEDNPEEFEEAIGNYSGLVICSSGNSGDNLDELTCYPQHYDLSNIIVVGAIDENDARSVWSFNQSSSYGANMVDIYAPGTDIYSTYCRESDYDYLSGTSQAAPFVTGVAALLWSVDPNLTALQIKDCILNGADEIEIEVEPGFLGVGRETQVVKKLDAWGAFKYLMNNYPSFARTIGFNDVTYAYDIDADAEYMKDHTAMMKLTIADAGQYTFTVSADDAIDVKFYDSSITEITTTQAKTNNNGTVEFTVTLSSGTYYLRTNYINSTSEGTITVEVDCPPHTHNYTEYAKYSATHHIQACECGATGTVTSPHVVKSAEAGNRLANCMLCGQLVLLDNTIVQVPGLNSITQVTPNGSYILPNGIIVLVDEDIEAYLNGTLVFYDKDDLPVVQ